MLSRKEKLLFDEFITKSYKRLRKGNKLYNRAYVQMSNKELLVNIEEELCDVTNYCFFLFTKIKEMKKVMK